MGKFGNRVNFRLPVFGGFTRFGVWRIQKKHKIMRNFGSSANFRLPVFGGFTRFGVWRIQKKQI